MADNEDRGKSSGEKIALYALIITAIVGIGAVVIAVLAILADINSRTANSNPETIVQTQVALAITQTQIVSINKFQPSNQAVDLPSSTPLPTVISTQIATNKPSNPTSESVLLTSTHTQTSDVSVQTATAIPIPFPPSPVSIASGKTFSPIKGWGWICTGDISVTLTNGTTVSLYDNSQQTGLMLVIEPDSKITINAPYGGYCEPFSQTEKSSRVSELTSSMLASGCAGKCSRVNIKEIDINGTILSDNWSS